MNTTGSEELGQKGARRHDERIPACETVGIHKVEVHDDLERMGRLRYIVQWSRPMYDAP
jgi:hypothetical protein